MRKSDRERWNDWGIGLLLQGDLKGAEYAFKQVTNADPSYADGWLNVARALIQEGETDAAKPFIRALPLTMLNDALRAVMNDAAPLTKVMPQLAFLALWGIMTFAIGLRIFRWQ